MTTVPIPPQEFPGMMSTAEVARFLGVTKRHVYRLVQEGRVPHYKWGRLLRFHPGEIAAWLDEFRRSPGGEQQWG
ncbi:MAG TPA: helix-turn-helix domain-containing protein [Acidimicrobiales bacterium]|nr:helix-turn-helix domain-containing protein [Acidimicrobiales bacterium]